MDFHSLPRRELQALCKKNRIPANMTNVAMADALRALKSVEGVGELQAATGAQFVSPQKSEAKAGVDAPRTSRRSSSRKLPVASVEPKEQQGSPLPRARRVTVKASELMRLVAEGEGDKVEEKDLDAEQPPAPAAPMMQEAIPRTTRKRASKKEEAKEENGDDAVEAITSKTPATRNGGRRPTTRREAASSAPVEEAQGEQMVPPSRTARRTRQASKAPAGDSVPAIAPLRRSTRARGTVSKMSPLAPEDSSQQEKDAEAMDSLDSEIKLQELDVVQEKSNSGTEICPSVIDNANQIPGEVEDDKLMEEESEQQEEGVENKDSHNEEDHVLVLSNDKSSEDVLEEKVGEAIELCHQDRVEQGEQVAEVETICQEEEESSQADNSLSGLEGSPVLGLISPFEDLVISEVEDKQSMQDEDNSLVLQETKDADTNLVVGQEVEGEKLSSENFVVNKDVAGKQSMEVEDKSLVLQETKDADTYLVVEGENLSLEDFVVDGDAADNQSTHDEDKSLELGETKDAGSDPLVAQEVESENLSSVLVEGSGTSPYPWDMDACGDDGSSEILAEVEELSIGKNQTDLEFIVGSDDTADDASNLKNLTESTGEMLAPKADMMKECAELDEVSAEVENTTEKEPPYEKLHEVSAEVANTTEKEPPSEKLHEVSVEVENSTEKEPPSEKREEDDVSAEVENTTEKDSLCLEEEEMDNRCVNYSSESQESDAANKENMTGINVGTEENKVRINSEPDKQNIDLKSCSLRKLKSLLREKISNENQKIEKKRSALAQLDENCLQRAS